MHVCKCDQYVCVCTYMMYHSMIHSCFEPTLIVLLIAVLHANGVHRSKPTPIARKHVTSESSSSPTSSQSRAQFSEPTSTSSFTVK